MTEEAKITLKHLNKKFFDDNIDEIKWSDENKTLVIIMKTNSRFTFNGDLAKDIYKQLVKSSMQ